MNTACKSLFVVVLGLSLVACASTPEPRALTPLPPDPDGYDVNYMATIELELLTTAAGQTLFSVTDGGQPRLFGVPVIQSIGMTADTVAVGNFGQAVMVHNREGVTIDMSESDSDNFTKNLVTIRAERRLALATERPAAIRAGDLTPA